MSGTCTPSTTTPTTTTSVNCALEPTTTTDWWTAEVGMGPADVVMRAHCFSNCNRPGEAGRVVVVCQSSERCFGEVIRGGKQNFPACIRVIPTCTRVKMGREHGGVHTADWTEDACGWHDQVRIVVV